MIISHVSDEVKYNGSFIPYPIRMNPTAANFDAFLKVFMPGNDFASIRDEINTTYASTKFNNQLNRVGILIRDAAFTCNTRQLFDAYSSKIPTWMMNYHFLAAYDAAVHASDLLPTFCNDDLNVAKLLSNCANVPWVEAKIIGPYIRKTFAHEYQSFLKSHAIYGDPNKGAQGGAKKVEWPVATTSSADNHDHVMNVMQPYYPTTGPPFQILGQDPNNTATSCEFWNHIAGEIMDIVGKHQQESSLVVQDVESLPEVELKH